MASDTGRKDEAESKEKSKRRDNKNVEAQNRHTERSGDQRKKKLNCLLKTNTKYYRSHRKNHLTLKTSGKSEKSCHPATCCTSPLLIHLNSNTITEVTAVGFCYGMI